MVTIEHGDLIEQRRGGVDVLRILVRNLALYEQSGAVSIRSSSDTHERSGWLLFRLGQPVMAFYKSEKASQGLEALLSIEQDALEVDSELNLYELTMNALRSTMAAHPESVLHLEHQEPQGDGESWWSSVRLPSSSWRRASRLEDIETLALDTEHRRRSTPGQAGDLPQLEPGVIYLLDSPDPHPLIHLGVELAERGMPLLGLFGLPHANTDSTHRLPTPQCYALLSPHGPYEVLDNREKMEAVVNAFQWGNERSVIVLDGLDRVGNAFGESGMLDLFRSVCDGVRFNDHVALVTTDLEMFETAVQRSILSEVNTLRLSSVEGWINDPDVLWDHPLLLAPDEEEEQWLAAQIQHQGAKVGAQISQDIPVVEGGSFEPDEAERAQATQALSEVVESWPDGQQSTMDAIEDAPNEVIIGETPWRLNEQFPVNPGRFVSESTPSKTETMPQIPHQQRVATPSRSVEPEEPKVRRPRRPQRLPKRKATPSLPSIKSGQTPARSSAVVTSAPDLPNWPASKRVKKAYRKENMDVFATKQERALERQNKVHTTNTASVLKETVSRSKALPEAEFPPNSISKTVNLPSSTKTKPLSNSLRPVQPSDSPSREASAKKQSLLNLDKVYAQWSTFEESDDVDSKALLKRYKEALDQDKGDD